MEQKYVIAGRSLATMFQWQGASIFDRDEAQRYADDLNNDPQNQDHSGAKLCFYWPKAVAPDTLDTSDLDTQPIVTFDDGPDTIILRRDAGE